jgi:hypothetical protein
LLLIRDGKPVQVTQPVLLDFIEQYLGAPYLVDRGGADGLHFVLELQPVTIPRSGDVTRLGAPTTNCRTCRPTNCRANSTMRTI